MEAKGGSVFACLHRGGGDEFGCCRGIYDHVDQAAGLDSTPAFPIWLGVDSGWSNHVTWFALGGPSTMLLVLKPKTNEWTEDIFAAVETQGLFRFGLELM